MVCVLSGLPLTSTRFQSRIVCWTAGIIVGLYRRGLYASYALLALLSIFSGRRFFTSQPYFRLGRRRSFTMSQVLFLWYQLFWYLVGMAPRKSSAPKETAQYYRDSPEARKKKDAYNTKFNRKSGQKAKRRQLAKGRRDRGMMGKGGKDLSHTKRGGLVAEKPSVNRARNRGKK